MTTPIGIRQNKLIKCRIFTKKGSLAARYVKPLTPVMVPCGVCGDGDMAYAKDHDTHICFSCYAAKEKA